MVRRVSRPHSSSAAGSSPSASSPSPASAPSPTNDENTLTGATPSAPLLGWFGVSMVCVVLSLFSLSLHLLVGLGYEGGWLDNTTGQFINIVAVLSIFIAVPLTHGLAGGRRYGSYGYSFFQPFIGGFRFVILQILGWAIYSITLIAMGYIAYIGIKTVSTELLASVGLGGFISQILVFLSLQYFVSANRRNEREQQRIEEEQQGTEDEGETEEEQDKGVGAEKMRQKLIKVKSLSKGAIMSPVMLSRRLTHINDSYADQAASMEIFSWSAIFSGSGLVGLVLTVVSILLSIMVESAESGWRPSMHPHFNHALISTILLGVPVSHIFTGRRSHSAYQLFQPFRGGAKFVTLQALSWTLWTLAFIAFVASFYLSYNSVHGFGAADESFITSTALTGVMSQALLLLSLKYFDSTMSSRIWIWERFRCGRRVAFTPETSPIPSPTHAMNKQADYATSFPVEERPLSLLRLTFSQWAHAFQLLFVYFRSFNAHELRMDIVAFLVVATFYLIPLIGAMACVIPLYLVYYYSHIWWINPTIAVFVSLYALTFINKPQFTGNYSWSGLRSNLFIWSCFERYFQFKLISHAGSDLSNGKGPYIMGFHPHGIYPTTILWATRGPQFRSLYPNFDIDVCGASIMFYSPVLREVCMWAGGREVSASSIRHALKNGRSVLLIPGGQREMMKSSASKKRLTLVIKHKGFLKMALQLGHSLVPVLSFGECETLENIRAPTMQAWSIKRLGFGFPLFPYGRWWSPLPNSIPITVVIGKPLAVGPPVAQPTEEQLNAIHEAYYGQIKEMFDTHKEEAGYKDCTLVYEH